LIDRYIIQKGRQVQTSDLGIYRRGSSSKLQIDTLETSTTTKKCNNRNSTNQKLRESNEQRKQRIRRRITIEP
jgi:hypothetical protein